MEVQDLVKFAKECKGEGDWTMSSLIRVSGQLAVKVNAIQNLSGLEKQALVCQALKLALPEKDASLKQAVDEVVPASLDLALAVGRGKLDLKKVKKSVWVRYFSCCVVSVVGLLAAKQVISQDQAKQIDSVLVAVEEKVVGVVGDETFEKENPMRSSVVATVPVVVSAVVASVDASVVASVVDVATADPTVSVSLESSTQESKSEETPVSA